MNLRLSGLIFTVILLMGCADTSCHALQEQADPLEAFNRMMFEFNYNFLDVYVLRPVAVAWRDYVPMPARNGLSNFISNLEEPTSMVNAFLRGNLYRGCIHFNRFFLNSLWGIGGLIDVAGMTNPMLIREESSRFGSTLGYYKISYGPYIMLPGYGGFTFREDGGNWVDTLYPMLSYLTFWMSAGKWIMEGIETRAQWLDSDNLLRNSSDPYMMAYKTYFQRHNFIANGGSLKPEKNPNANTIQSYLDEIDST
ncbi:phospholipid-binding lipoprotein MlaA [Candidatus Gillettellia adelgis]